MQWHERHNIHAWSLASLRGEVGTRFGHEFVRFDRRSGCRDQWIGRVGRVDCRGVGGGRRKSGGAGQKRRTRRGVRRANSESERRSRLFHGGCDLPHASLRRAREGWREILGPVTVLVNAAGGNDPSVTVTEKMRLEEIKLDDWRANFDMNLVGGVLAPCQEFGPGMVDRKRGSIINIASVSAHIPLSRVVAYSAAKAAALSVTQFLAREWAASKVRVNSITPGFFPAEQNRRLLFNEGGTPTARAQAVLQLTPMKRFGDAEELIGAAVFTASRRGRLVRDRNRFARGRRVFVPFVNNRPPWALFLEYDAGRFKTGIHAGRIAPGRLAGGPDSAIREVAARGGGRKHFRTLGGFAGDGEPCWTTNCGDGVAEENRCAGFRILHELREPQGAGPGGKSEGLVAGALAGIGAPDHCLRNGEQGPAGRIGGVFSNASAR